MTGTIESLQHVPGGPLADFVALLWYWRGHSMARSTERVLPTGTMELVISLGPNGYTGGVSGPHSEAFFIERTADDELLGIHFKPGGAFPFFGLPAGDLRNAFVTLADLWGPTPTGELMGLLYEAPNVPAKFRVLERWLIRVAARELQRHPAVDLGLTTFRDQWALGAAREAQQRSNLSPRRFIHLFRDQVGLTPKLYCRIRRFQYVLDRVADARDVDWLRTALACGYFDQSHFIHDFRAFTGLRPTEYWNLRIAGQANHVRVPD